MMMLLVTHLLYKRSRKRSGKSDILQYVLVKRVSFKLRTNTRCYVYRQEILFFIFFFCSFFSLDIILCCREIYRNVFPKHERVEYIFFYNVELDAYIQRLTVITRRCKDTCNNVITCTINN